MKYLLTIFFALLFLSNASSKERNKIGLALSGGGAKGGAHIGVLKVLEELNVPIDYIAGTSAGSIVGGLYAAGYNLEEIEKVMVETNWTDTFNDRPSRPNKPFRRKQDDKDFLIKAHLGLNDGKIQFPLGVLQGQRLEQMFTRLTVLIQKTENFDELKIPFRAVAADIETGRSVVIGKGNLANAIRASMSIPGLLSPVDWNGRLLVDGGIANNLPIDVVRRMGADVVIAVDISAPLSRRDELNSVLAVTGQLTTILTATNVANQVATLTDQDIYIAPDLKGIDTLDFNGAIHSIAPGVDAARSFKDKLLSYSENNPSTAQLKIKTTNESITVSFIEIENNTNLNDQILLERISIRPGHVFNLEQIEKDIEQIYGLDVFQEVSYEIIEKDNMTGLKIHAQKKNWGPNYLQFGMAIEDDFSGNNDYTLGIAYTRTAMNSLGGELRIEGNIGRRTGINFDFYQPLDYKQNYFINPNVTFGRTNINVFDDADQLGTAQVSLNQLNLGTGRNFGNNQSLSLNFVNGRANIKNISGQVPEASLGSFELGEFSVLYNYDSLNSLNLPTSGNQIQLSYSRSLSPLGSDGNYYQYGLRALHSQTHGRNTYLFKTVGGYSNNENIPIYKEFNLGGFANISGLVSDQLNGPYLGLVSLVNYHRLGNVDLLPVYVGASLEYGNIWQHKDDISFNNNRLAGSIFIGVDTILGPIYLAYGKTESVDGSIYLFIGNPFGGN